MKLSLLSGIMLACAATAFALQTPSDKSSTNRANQKLTLTGCVSAGATATDPFMLSSPMVVTTPPATGAPPARGALRSAPRAPAAPSCQR